MIKTQLWAERTLQKEIVTQGKKKNHAYPGQVSQKEFEIKTVSKDKSLTSSESLCHKKTTNAIFD